MTKMASEGQQTYIATLIRTRIGPVLLGELAPGETRELTDRELGTLMAEVGL